MFTQLYIDLRFLIFFYSEVCRLNKQVYFRVASGWALLARPLVKVIGMLQHVLHTRTAASAEKQKHNMHVKVVVCNPRPVGGHWL